MENLKFTKRVFGCAVIKSIDGNYNADFTKQPRTLLDGTVYATDKALKYTVRHFLHQNYPKDKILYFTRYRTDVENGQMIPKSLKELYEHLFGDLPKGLSNKAPDKFILFYFDGEEVKGVLPKPAKKEEFEKYLKSDGEEELIQLKDIFVNLVKNATENKPSDIKVDDIKNLLNDDEDNCYFQFSKKTKGYEKIDVKDSDFFETALTQYELIALGGYDKLKILHSLLQCIDVRLFGATYTGDTNVSIHGPVQINHGKDRFFYKNGVIENLTYSEQIKSPVRNDKAKGGDAEMTTIGSQSKSMEAHYVHHFSVNPKNLEDHIAIANQIANRKDTSDKTLDGLTELDIQKLIEGLRSGASNYNSTAKTGVENELLIWVELLSGCKIVLPNFTELVKVTRNEGGKTEIDLTDLNTLLETPYISACIGRIHIYYNNVMVDLKSTPVIESKVFKFDILTGTQLPNEVK